MNLIRVGGVATGTFRYINIGPTGAKVDVGVSEIFRNILSGSEIRVIDAETYDDVTTLSLKQWEEQISKALRLVKEMIENGGRTRRHAERVKAKYGAAMPPIINQQEADGVRGIGGVCFGVSSLAPTTKVTVRKKVR